jgi:hypothetical protein
VIRGSVAYPITSQTGELFSAPGTPLTLFNDGPAVVYLSTQSNVLTASALPLAVGASVQWDANKACFGTTFTPGAIASVRALDNSGALNDPHSIAAAIIAQGLAGDIAAAIAASSLNAAVAAAIAARPELNSQLGSLTPGGFVVPNKVGSYSALQTTGSTTITLIPGFYGATLCLRTLTYARSQRSGSNGTNGGSMQLLDVNTGIVLYQASITGTGFQQVDLLGLALSNGAGVQLQISDGGNIQYSDPVVTVNLYARQV